MSPLERFRLVAGLSIGHWREQFPAHRPLGIYNAYVPIEVLNAAGMTPVYLFHQADDGGYARAHLPTFTCWPGRSLIDQALAGDLDGLAGIAFGQTCDTVQALVDIWRKAMPAVPVYHVGVPSNLAGAAVRPYFIAELNQLRQALGDLTDDALRQAILVCNQTRSLVGRLYERAADLRPTDLYAALRAGLIMPKVEYNALLAKLLDRLLAAETVAPRLLLVGPHLADPMIYSVLQEAGALVVDDLLDIGHRYYAGAVSEDGDPIVALVDHYLALLPTPAKHHPSYRRGDYLLDLVTGRQADGVIFARQKFCDPHGFDTVPLRSALDEAGIPHLLLELEQTSQIGQMRTRVEAFLEMVKV